jgi:Tfp pilus assembly protein PilX
MQRIKGNNGYALVASMMVMLLITALGALAMITSVSEQYITSNLGEDQMLFFYAEQGVDRILSHLNNLEGGLFANVNGLGFDPAQASNVLPPRLVMNNVKAMYLDGTTSPTYQQRQIMRISAYMDPEDFEATWDRGISRPVAISIRVTNTRTGTQQAYRVYARPRSVWDFAYYSMNHMPTARLSGSPAGENCASGANDWYSCHPVFLDGDIVMGDTYVANTVYSPTTNYVEAYPDTAKVFVRGSPKFAGDVRWRGPDTFQNVVASSANQTKGGLNTYALPQVGRRYKPASPAVKMPRIDVLMDKNQGYAKSSYYDLKFGPAGTGSGNTQYVWRLIFRNDIDTNTDGVAANSWVASAITPAVHKGVSPTLGSPANEDRGTMMVYRVPFTADDPDAEDSNVRAAFYGRTMDKRDTVMRFAGGSRWAPTTSWDNLISGKKCRGLMTYAAPEDNTHDDISSYYYMYVPSKGLSTQGTGTGCGGTYNGAIFVEGDVIVSGILDAQVTIVATGNIYIDHEIEYENHPASILMSDYSSATEPDMLGLFAGGNVIIPNSYPDWGRMRWVPSQLWPNHAYRDDWSDPHNPLAFSNTFAPIGLGDSIPLTDDVGDEDLHAVIMSYGHNCTGTSGTYTCTPKSAASIREFRTGFYAQPRTASSGTHFTRASIADPAYPSGGPFDTTGGNDSGFLSVVGAVIQNIPGRLAYDYVKSGSVQSSNCTTGRGSGCKRIGFSRVSYMHDPRMKYMLPPYPRVMVSAGGSNMFSVNGFAGWEIISWEEIKSNSDIVSPVW